MLGHFMGDHVIDVKLKSLKSMKFLLLIHRIEMRKP